MPKKRCATWSRTKKEKQIITTRLIEISLKVEDCIYKQKPISVWEAEQYIREVSSYKVQCSRDERSLQVIEKITRCMKAIILDHQDPEIHAINEDGSIPAGVVCSGSISPVYSIPEEDRFQLTQVAVRSDDNIEIIDLSNIDDDDEPMHNENNTATADYAGSKVTVEVDIHRGMSSLSLKDSGEPLDIAMSITETNCSQSILNNFDGIEQMQQNMINNTSQRTVVNDLVGKVTGSRQITNLTQQVRNHSVNKPDNNFKTTIAPTKPVTICNAKNNLKLGTVVQNKEPIKVTNTTSYIPNAFNQKNNNVISETFNPAETNCSQSILNNFEGIEQMQQNTININCQRASTAVGNVSSVSKSTNFTQPVGNKPDVNAKTTISPTKPIIICVPKNYLKINPVVQNKEPIRVSNATSYVTNAFNQKNNNITFNPVTNNIPQSQGQTWYDSNRTCTINDVSHSMKYTNHSTQPRQIHNHVNQVAVTKAGIWNGNTPRNTSNAAEKENQPIKSNENSEAPLLNNKLISTTAVIQEKTATIKKKRGPKKKLKDEKEIKQKSKIVSRAAKSTKDKSRTTKNTMIPIYNTNVVDDLSWIENIRYVREIRADENDSTLHLEESFWDNFYLPANWTDNEFL